MYGLENLNPAQQYARYGKQDVNHSEFLRSLAWGVPPDGSDIRRYTSAKHAFGSKMVLKLVGPPEFFNSTSLPRPP